MKYRIGIVGFGYVGKGMHRLFEDWVEAIYDPHVKTIKTTPDNIVLRHKASFADLDLAIICVPTNTAKDGWSCDTSIVESSVKWLAEVNPNLLILVKSTVAPSKIEGIKKKYKARLCCSPEYLGEGKYFVPFWKYPDPKEVKYHTFQIFGGDKKDTSECVDIFIKKMGPHIHFYQTDLKTAALAKFMENAWGSQKVIFCNEFYEIAKAFGVDYNELRELWAADSRVEKSHTAVFSKARGYSGKCFPKDIRAIVRDSEKAGYKPKLLREVIKSNNRIRSKHGQEKV